MKKENNPLYMTRKEFDEYKENNKYCDYPYEYYRLYPLLNHKQQQELIVFMRTNKKPIELLKYCTKLLEEEGTQK